MKNEPIWIDVDVTGEMTGTKYFGRFSIKRYLTHIERGEAVRLAETLMRGIQQDINFRTLLSTIAFLNVHIVETDAKWWAGDGTKGLDLLDEAPVWELSKQLYEVQKPSDEDKGEAEKVVEEPKKKK